MTFKIILPLLLLLLFSPHKNNNYLIFSKVSFKKTPTSKLKKPKIYKTPSHGNDSISNCNFVRNTFIGEKYYTDKLFLNETIFNESIFKSSVSFYRVEFLHNVSFDNTSFYNGLYFKEFHFDSDLSFNSANAYSLTTEVSNQFISFNSGIFGGQTTFNGAQFTRRFNINNAYFCGSTDFSSTIFKVESEFNKNTFFEPLDFTSSKFYGNVDFIADTLLKTTNFNGTQFFSICDFSYSKFSKSLKFGSLQSWRRADTSHNAVFYKAVFFNGTKFGDSTIFDNTIFFSQVIFDGAELGNFVSFRNISLKKLAKIDFSNSVLPAVIDFSEIDHIDNEVNFLAARLENEETKDSNFKKHLIYLYKTDITKIHIDYLHFKLIFKVSSKEKELQDDQKETIYEGLLKNFAEKGQKESYEKLSIEYEKFKWHKSSLSFLAWVPELWWNYGFNKERVFFITFFALFIFSSLNYFFLEKLNKNVYPLDNFLIKKDYWLRSRKITSSIAARYEALNRKKVKKFSFSFFIGRYWDAIVYTSTIFFSFSLKGENINFNNRWGTLYLFAVYLIGIICLAYMANYIIQK